MTDPLHRPTDPLNTPRMTDDDIIRLWSWMLTDAVADRETRLGIAALLREVERARKTESQALKRVERLDQLLRNCFTEMDRLTGNAPVRRITRDGGLDG